MNFRFACVVLTGWLVAATQADIIWSGNQNLSGSEQDVDFNFDTLNDVVLSYSVGGDASGENGRIGAYVDGFGVDGSNRILVSASNGHYAALPFGNIISLTPDPLLQWAGGTLFSGTVSDWIVYPPFVDDEWSGLLGENGNAYIGIEFDIAGATHYGWIKIALGPEGYLGFRDPITTSWAYESTPGAPIVAGAIPEPSTGLLTMIGSISLLMYVRLRRRGGVISKR